MIYIVWRSACVHCYSQHPREVLKLTTFTLLTCLPQKNFTFQHINSKREGRRSSPLPDRRATSQRTLLYSLLFLLLIHSRACVCVCVRAEIWENTHTHARTHPHTGVFRQSRAWRPLGPNDQGLRPRPTHLANPQDSTSQAEGVCVCAMYDALVRSDYYMAYSSCSFRPCALFPIMAINHVNCVDACCSSDGLQ